MDTDEDGTIRREEFRGRPLLFDRLDADKDGSLSPEEVRVGASRSARVRSRRPASRRSPDAPFFPGPLSPRERGFTNRRIGSVAIPAGRLLFRGAGTG
jgi:hypothetical protein